MSKRRNINELGQDLVEYAIIFPILFFVLVGIFDLGRIVFYYSALTNTAREGARWGVVHPDDPDNIEAIVCYYGVGLDLGCPNPLVSLTLIDQDSNGRDDYVQVQVSYDFQPVTPIIGSILGLGFGDVITLQGQSTMRIEN